MNAKYLQFAVLLLLCVLADQWSKQVASSRLAATHGWIDHPMMVGVSPEQDGHTVEAVLAAEFTRNDASEIREIARRYAFSPAGSRLTPETALKAGQTVKVSYRKVVVVPRYFDFEYTRNPGAAFGFLADGDSPWRTPFFIIISLLALAVIVRMLRTVDGSDQLAIWALALIAGGALGNFIDRVAYGWVIDFIAWRVGDYRWPTFNIADALISTGVALLLVQMGRDALRERRTAQLAPVVEE